MMMNLARLQGSCLRPDPRLNPLLSTFTLNSASTHSHALLTVGQDGLCRNPFHDDRCQLLQQLFAL